MPDDLTTDEIIKTFNCVGFSSPPSYLKSYSVLSNGEKMRVELARSLLSKKDIVVFDEFTSVVDRQVAKVGSFAVQKAVRKQNKKFISSKLAHEKARMGIFEDFMTLEQIQELADDSQVIIGGHSHSHTRLNNFANLYEKSDYIKRDTAQMITWFDKNLRTFPEHYCFPYNEDLDSLYQGLAKKQGIKYFYGNERIPVETLLRSQNPPETLDTLPAWSLPRHF
jgi:ABC-type branched-subunit amino acid transport system ATPase component